MNQLSENKKQSPIERALDDLSNQLDQLEKAVARIQAKTELIRAPFPTGVGCDAEHSCGSVLTSRLSLSTGRLRSLREALEQTTEEIEL